MTTDEFLLHPPNDERKFSVLSKNSNDNFRNRTNSVLIPSDTIDDLVRCNSNMSDTSDLLNFSTIKMLELEEEDIKIPGADEIIMV